MTDTLVLCYHAVSPSWPAELAITPDTLEAQVRRLLARGWHATTFTEAALAPPSARTLAITFDDAYASTLALALPVLQRLGVTATVFAPTAFMDGTPLNWPGIDHWLGGSHAAELTPLNWDGLRELRAAGWEVGSHTISHPHLTELDDVALRDELKASREACRRELGVCTSIAYPYGDVDRRVADAARSAGYLAGASLGRSLALRGEMRVPRVGIYRDVPPWRHRLMVSTLTRHIRQHLF